MLVKITKEHRRAVDCRTMVSFKEGEVLELDLDIAEDMIMGDYAIESVEEKVLDIKIENKAILSVALNKEESGDESKESKSGKKKNKSK